MLFLAKNILLAVISFPVILFTDWIYLPIKEKRFLAKKGFKGSMLQYVEANKPESAEEAMNYAVQLVAEIG